MCTSVQFSLLAIWFLYEPFPPYQWLSIKNVNRIADINITRKGDYVTVAH